MHPPVTCAPARSNFKLPAHEPGYPGGIFAPFVPGSLEELKVKEIKNGEVTGPAVLCWVCRAALRLPCAEQLRVSAALSLSPMILDMLACMAANPAPLSSRS